LVRVIGLGLILLLVAAALLVWQRPGILPRPAAPLQAADAFSAIEIATLQSGDIILRKGMCLPSDLVVALLGDGTGLSHCCMVLEGSAESGWRVVQSINASLTGIDGVQVQDLADFCRYNVADCLVAVRPSWSASQRAAAIEAAHEALARHLPFDNAYDSADDSALYCSELLVWILGRSGWWRPEWTMWQGAFVSFRSFLDPAHFTILVDHRPGR
jgi:hypothetical protein